jgi:hypothetical protein
MGGIASCMTLDRVRPETVRFRVRCTAIVRNMDNLCIRSKLEPLFPGKYVGR